MSSPGFGEALEITVTAGGGGEQGPPGVGVPVGGTTGQHLAKLSNTDYHTGWVAAGSGTGTVNDLNTNAPLSGGGNLGTSALTLSIAAGSTTTAGALRLATTAEATAQSSQAIAVTPAGLADRVPTSRIVTTTAPLTGGASLASNITLGVSQFTSTTPGVVPLSGGGAVNFLRADGTWTLPTAAVTIAGLPAGSTIDSFQSSTGVWPSRPTARTDIRVNWIGYPGDSTPPTVGVVTLVDSYTYRST